MEKIKSLKEFSRNNDIFIKDNQSTINDQTLVADSLGNFFHKNFSDKIIQGKIYKWCKDPQ